MSTISAKQERFCQEWVVDQNGTAAAVRAGYSKTSARSTAARLLAQNNVQERVAELQADAAKRIGLTHDKVLSELCKLAFTNLTDIVDITGGAIRIRTPLEVEDPAMWAAVSSIKEKMVNGEKVLAVTMHDKRATLEMLGRHLGMFKENAKETLMSGEIIHKIERVIVDTDKPPSKVVESEHLLLPGEPGVVDDVQ